MAVDGFDEILLPSKFTPRKTRPNGSNADGYTSARSKTNYTMGRGEGAAIVFKNIDVTISLDTNQSWVIEGKMTDELLKHEQGHYDITSLGARDLNIAALKLMANSVKALKDKFKKLAERIQTDINAANIRYDELTNHSQNKTEQEKWNKAIALEKRKNDGSIENLPK